MTASGKSGMADFLTLLTVADRARRQRQWRFARPVDARMLQWSVGLPRD
jgi:hypothetical protein